MRILSLDPTPLHEWSYLNAAPRGGSEVQQLPLLRATVDSLPPEVEAVIVLSDLQGMAPNALRDGAATLLGEALAEELALMGEVGDIPHPSTTGILLAGDLFSDPNAAKRGASGDVRSVWSAFASHFRWVAGVAGNHDSFGTPREAERFLRAPGVHLLDGEIRTLDGLAVCGVGGIIGRTDKPGRREEADQLERIEGVLRQAPEVLVLHEGPDFPEDERRGNPAIREAVHARAGLLVVCGHCHWDNALAAFENGAQVLNVDARAVLLMRPRADLLLSTKGSSDK